jgi:hypothetical protein
MLTAGQRRRVVGSSLTRRRYHGPQPPAKVVLPGPVQRATTLARPGWSGCWARWTPAVDRGTLPASRLSWSRHSAAGSPSCTLIPARSRDRLVVAAGVAGCRQLPGQCGSDRAGRHGLHTVAGRAASCYHARYLGLALSAATVKRPDHRKGALRSTARRFPLSVNPEGRRSEKIARCETGT